MRAIRIALIVALLLTTSCHTPATVTLTPAEPPKLVILPDAEDDGLICVVIPHAPPYDPAWRGIHCTTIHDLRYWLAPQLRAN